MAEQIDLPERPGPGGPIFPPGPDGDPEDLDESGRPAGEFPFAGRGSRRLRLS